MSWILAPAGAVAEPAVIQHYQVAGNTLAALKDSIRAAAPLGGRAFGLTRVTIEPRFSYGDNGAECRPINVVVDLKTTVTLPQWQASQPIPAALDGRWKRLEATVREHEMLHVEVAEEYAARLRHMLGAITDVDCATLEPIVVAKVKRLQAAHRFAQKIVDMEDRERLQALLP
nr:DUF922 domain-containing protein [Pseudohoeflea sp. DP4N28-3]